MWRFNLWLLRLLGEISLSLFAQLLGFRFGVGPASACRSPSGICCLPRQEEFKKRLIRGLWLTQVRGSDGYGMRGKPAEAEAGMTLQQPEVCHVFSRGCCPWITGPWEWRAAQTPGWGGVDSDLYLHTGLLVAAAATLVFHARLWDPALIVAALHISGAHLGGALNPLSSRNNGLLPLRQFETFSRAPSRLAVAHYPPSGCVHTANPSPLPGI